MTAFKDHTILITGAASGIGLATAQRLHQEGAQLVLIDRDDTARHLLPTARVHHGDVTDEEFWNALTLPTLTGAVINAGISGAATITEMTFAEWRDILSVNLDGAFLSLRAVLRHMAQQGAVVMVGSASGIKPEPATAAYGASKAALHHLARVAAKECAPMGIRVNAIAPSGVQTPVWQRMDFFEKLVVETGSEQAAFAQLAAMATPLGRFALPTEIAAQICFLLGPESETITGAILASDGGYTL